MSYQKGPTFARNMQSFQDHKFSKYLMHIEDGIEPTKDDDIIKIPYKLAIT